MIIGLTGGIGSGKSAAANYFAELGISVLDADHEAKKALDKNTKGYYEFLSKFGGQCLDDNKEINRLKLRDLIFNNPSKKLDLERIVHPIVRSSISTFISKASSPYTIIMVPLIFETQSQKNYDRIITVDCDIELQISRATIRDTQNEEQIVNIINKQATREERISISDDVILNNKSLADLKGQVLDLHLKYLELLNE
tara:strand:+ start:96 stop:689 length:594 start_codon:yes stop_codon:yes gene_type:complete